ncbi:26450_t:CDS:2, partial [Dentiscutata erythropus]
SMANDPSFYASLHTHTNVQHKYRKYNDNEFLNNIPQAANKTQESKEFNTDQITVPENNTVLFELFIEIIKYNYENGSSQLQFALEKLAERYNVAKAKSTSALTSFLYNINHNIDPLTRVKSANK